MRIFLVLLVLIIAFKKPAAQQQFSKIAATGNVYIAKLKNGYSFISPEGKPFVAIGIAHANMPPQSRRLPDDATAKLFQNNEDLFNAERDRWLHAYGFNTFSYTKPSKNGNQFYWVETLNLFPGFINKGGECPDLYSDSFRNAGIELIKKLVPAIANDKNLLGISLALPVLASPHQMPTRTWQRRNEKPTNYLYHLQSLDTFSTGKRKYIDYLQNKFGNVQTYCLKRNWRAAKSWSDLIGVDLSAYENPFYLHPDDAEFYRQMWSEVISLFASEIRKKHRVKLFLLRA